MHLREKFAVKCRSPVGNSTDKIAHGSVLVAIVSYFELRIEYLKTNR